MGDPRANGKFSDAAFIADVEGSYSELDLTMEAQACAAWLAGPKGRKRVTIVSTWMNWLKNALRHEAEAVKAGARVPGRATITTDPKVFAEGDGW